MREFEWIFFLFFFCFLYFCTFFICFYIYSFELAFSRTSRKTIQRFALANFHAYTPCICFRRQKAHASIYIYSICIIFRAIFFMFIFMAKFKFLLVGIKKMGSAERNTRSTMPEEKLYEYSENLFFIFLPNNWKSYTGSFTIVYCRFVLRAIKTEEGIREGIKKSEFHVWMRNFICSEVRINQQFDLWAAKHHGRRNMINLWLLRRFKQILLSLSLFFSLLFSAL